MQARNDNLAIIIKNNGNIPPQWKEQIKLYFNKENYVQVEFDDTNFMETTNEINNEAEGQALKKANNLGDEKYYDDVIIIGHGDNLESPYFGMRIEKAAALLKRLNNILKTNLVDQEQGYECRMRIQVCNAANPGVKGENLYQKLKAPKGWKTSAPMYYSFIRKGQAADLPEKMGSFKFGEEPGDMALLADIITTPNVQAGADPARKQAMREALRQSIETMFTQKTTKEDRFKALLEYCTTKGGKAEREEI